MSMNEMTVKAKLGWSLGGLSALLILVVVLAVMALNDVHREFQQFVEGVSARSALAHRVREAVQSRAIAARNLVLITDEATIRAERQQVQAAHEEAQQSLAQLAERLTAAQVPADVMAAFNRLRDVESRYAPVALNIVELAVQGQHEAAIQKMNADCRPLLAELLQAAQAYGRLTDERSQAALKAAEASYQRDVAWLVGAGALSVIVALLAAHLIIRSLLHDLGAEPRVLRDVLGRVASGDLTGGIAVRAGDERSVLAAAVRMQDALSRVVASVRQSSEHLAQEGAEIASANHDLEHRTIAQARELESTAQAMTQLGQAVIQNTDHARQANQLALHASEVAAEGGQVVGRVVDTMREINDSSRRIADIIGVIDGIAFQTNILALNAAVEAARAGEQGRGFAVVAGEVRSLAGRSAEAAKEIKTLISASVQRVEQGTALVDQAGSTMNDVVTSIGRVTDIMSGITSASAEQSQGVQQVGEAVRQLDHATQQNAALVEETAAVAGKLRDQAQGLVQTVSVFKIRDGMNWTAVVPAPPPSSIRRPPAAARPAAAPRVAAAAPAPRLAAARPASSPAATRPASKATAGSPPATARAPAALPPSVSAPAAEGEWESF
jgi:methyl-accepting chemotaxis protein